jgi:hypothetical protein
VAAAVLFTSVGAHQPSAQRERVLYRQATGRNPLNHQDDFSGPALRPDTLSYEELFRSQHGTFCFCQVRSNAVHATRGERRGSCSPLHLYRCENNPHLYAFTSTLNPRPSTARQPSAQRLHRKRNISGLSKHSTFSLLC